MPTSTRPITSLRSRTARVAAHFAAGVVALAAAACSPALNWREFVPEGSGVRVMLPCRPDHLAREVSMDGIPMRMEMLACEAAGATWSISFVDVADPARVAPLLTAWRAAAIANVQGRGAPPSPVAVAGMTPNDAAQQVTVDGRLPDGAAVQEHAAFFSHGLRLYSAAVIGARLDSAAAAAFFEGLKFPA